MTALHWNASRAKDKVEFLLEHGADPHLKNNNGDTPLGLMPELADLVKEVEAKKAAKEQKP
jgi:hypothetical protein